MQVTYYLRFYNIISEDCYLKMSFALFLINIILDKFFKISFMHTDFEMTLA